MAFQADDEQIIPIFAIAHIKKSLKMKRLAILWLSFLACAVTLSAQNPLNAEADSILGEYEVRHQGEYTKVRVTKDTDGTYRAQVYYLSLQ